MSQTIIQDIAGTSGIDSRRHGDEPRDGKDGGEARSSAGWPTRQYGLFSIVEEAVAAATEAQRHLSRLSLDDRATIVNLIKSMAGENAAAWGALEFRETKIGRLEHKVEKLRILQRVPGVEWLKTNATSGSNGLCLEEFAPFGVIGVVTPLTHSVPTLSANAINLIAAGNSMVCNPHPGGANCAAHAVRAYNRAIAEKFGIEHLITLVVPPTHQTAQAIFDHQGISLLIVTGGPGIARIALAARKRAIVAGPGNPPVVVDDTACLEHAASSLVTGAAYDNNLLCIAEKQVFCVERVFDRLMVEVGHAGGYVLNRPQIDALTRLAFTRSVEDGKFHVNRTCVGRDASALAQAAGVPVPAATRLLVGETEFEHPFVQEEQMMPILPFVRVKDVNEAIDLAIESEHGHRHTALIHSRNLDAITRFGRDVGATVLVVNGASTAGLGVGGPGYLSYSIATPTGEGLTNPLTFTRYRRAMMIGSLRMI
jgi:aldehyde dehydrogenase